MAARGKDTGWAKNHFKKNQIISIKRKKTKIFLISNQEPIQKLRYLMVKIVNIEFVFIYYESKEGIHHAKHGPVFVRPISYCI